MTDGPGAVSHRGRAPPRRRSLAEAPSPHRPSTAHRTGPHPLARARACRGRYRRYATPPEFLRARGCGDGATLATVGEMSRSARARLVCSAAAALLAGALGGGCGSSPPMDKNFGTDLGADFRAPITDAGSDGDTNVTPEASVDGTGTGGTTARRQPRAAGQRWQRWDGRRRRCGRKRRGGRRRVDEGHGHQPQFVRKKIVEEPMQVVCATCQLSFDAPEGATGLVCPICRGPLRAAGRRWHRGRRAARKTAQEWSGGDLDDLIAILQRAGRLGAGRGAGRHRRRGRRRGSPAGRRRLGLDLRRQGDRRRARSAARGQADPLPRRAAAPQPGRRQPERAGTGDGNARRPRAGAPHALLRGLRHQLLHRRVARQRDGARRVQARRDQRRHRGRHRRARATRRGDAVVVGQLPPGRPRVQAAGQRAQARQVGDRHPSARSGPRAVRAGRAQASSTKTIFGMPVAEVAKARAAAEATKAAEAAVGQASPRRRAWRRRRPWSRRRRSRRASRRPPWPRAATPAPLR